MEKLVLVDRKMDSVQYQSIQEVGYNTGINMHGLDRSNLIFQQDNDPKHTSKSTKNWMEVSGFNVLDWPSNSPDMNPIEDVWNDINIRAIKNHSQAKNINELKSRAEEKWSGARKITV